jgi:hypothetical protein
VGSTDGGVSDLRVIDTYLSEGLVVHTSFITNYCTKYFLLQKILCAVASNKTRMCKATAQNVHKIKPCTFYDTTD